MDLKILFAANVHNAELINSGASIVAADLKMASVKLVENATKDTSGPEGAKTIAILIVACAPSVLRAINDKKVVMATSRIPFVANWFVLVTLSTITTSKSVLQNLALKIISKTNYKTIIAPNSAPNKS